MYRWKSTIRRRGRTGHLFGIRGNNTTQGLGFHEYLQLCEDLGGRSVVWHQRRHVPARQRPLGQMGQWVQDALDAGSNTPTAQLIQCGAEVALKLVIRRRSICATVEIGNGKRRSGLRRALATARQRTSPKISRPQIDRGPPIFATAPIHGIRPPIYGGRAFTMSRRNHSMNRANQYDSYDRNGPKIFRR